MKEQPLFDTSAHLNRLLAEFPSLTEEARDLQSPNPADDEYIRCGIVGFGQTLTIDRWAIPHFHYVRTFRDEVSDGKFSDDWIRFTCLAAGYFVGLAEAQIIDHVRLRLSEAHTPGFMWLRCEAFGVAEQNVQDKQMEPRAGWHC